MTAQSSVAVGAAGQTPATATVPATGQATGAVLRKGRFLNPDGSRAGQHPRNVLRLFREGFGPPWPPVTAAVIRSEAPPAPLPGHVAVTFVGHSTFLLRFHNGPTLLTDPVWSDRCSPFRFAGPKRVRPPGLALDALPPLDAVLLSHNHYDHMDLATLRRLMPVRVVTGLGNGRYLARKGLPGAEELDWWQHTTLPDGTRLTYLPARHFSARTPFDAGRMLWGGFAVHTPGGGSLYFAGDTAYGSHLREIGDRVGPFDVGLLPIGAYDPRWFMEVVHTDPAEAVRMHRDLRVRTGVAMHFGTFKLTREAIDAPVLGLEAARAAAGIPPERFLVPEFGGTLMLPLGGASASAD
ncbi:MBL fold metallo-hydrolase [Roseomonas elaeocarpi]|uniref:MBL fold metallo-hydrolase n=1 Tax=Roseomonas elaeocarpi TaxID=907779 RepID=A0ABV6JYY3_9PROT